MELTKKAILSEQDGFLFWRKIYFKLLSFSKRNMILYLL